jgi:hypothetical protein
MIGKRRRTALFVRAAIPSGLAGGPIRARVVVGTIPPRTANEKGVATARVLASLLLMIGPACRRDPAEWPPREIANLEATCPQMLGASRPCRCYAKEFSRRIPFSRSKEFAAAPEGSQGFEDVLGAMEGSMSECGRDMELGP